MTYPRTLTWEQETLCAKVRVLEDPDRLAERLREIDPSIYHDLLISMDLPPSLITGASDEEAAAHDPLLSLAQSSHKSRRWPKGPKPIVLPGLGEGRG